MNLRIEYDSYKIKDDITIEEIRLAIQYIQIKRETGKVSKDTCYKEEIYYGKRNKLLADLVVEYHKLQSFHWYLKGYHFFDDHAKLEEYYDSVAEAVDGVAENMLKLGLKPESTMKGFLALSSIEEAKNKEVTSEEAYTEVLKDFKYLLDEVKSVKALAEKDNVYVTSNLMDDYIEMFYKANWMVGQVLKK